MFPSKDGKKFGSAYVAKRRDQEHEKSRGTEKPENPMVGKEEPRTSNDGEALMSKANASAPDNNVQSNPENVDPKAILAEHGPAASTDIHSDHEKGEHHVTSHHKSGHTTHSKHSSMQDAHKMAAELAEAGEQQPAGAEEHEGPESDGFSMPKLG